MKNFRQTSLALALLTGLVATAAAAQDAPPPPDPEDAPMGRPMRGPGIDFVTIDTDKNGIVTKTELLTRATSRLSLADSNGDGALDRAELLAAMPGPRENVLMVFAPDPAQLHVDRLLDRMGAADSGRVVIAVLAQKNVDDLLAALDSNHDGSLSPDEAKSGPGGPGHHGGKPRPPRG